MKPQTNQTPRIHTVIKRKKNWTWEYFCINCQHIVENPNKRCKGAK